MNEHSVAELFHDIVDGPEPPLGVSGPLGLSHGRRMRRHRRMLQGVVSAAAVVAVVAGGVTVSAMMSGASLAEQQVAGPGHVAVVAKQTGPAKQPALPPMRWDCRAELALPAPEGQRSDEFRRCIAPARAETDRVLRELGAKYEAVSVSPMTEGLRVDGGYPEFQGFFTTKSSGSVDFSWFYETHGAAVWSQCPRIDPAKTPLAGVRDAGPVMQCDERVLADGSHILIESPYSQNGYPSEETHVTRYRPDGLAIIVVGFGSISVDDLIELSGSPLLRG